MTFLAKCTRVNECIIIIIIIKNSRLIQKRMSRFINKKNAVQL